MKGLFKRRSLGRGLGGSGRSRGSQATAGLMGRFADPLAEAARLSEPEERAIKVDMVKDSLESKLIAAVRAGEADDYVELLRGFDAACSDAHELQTFDPRNREVHLRLDGTRVVVTAIEHDLIAWIDAIYESEWVWAMYKHAAEVIFSEGDPAHAERLATACFNGSAANWLTPKDLFQALSSVGERKGDHVSVAVCEAVLDAAANAGFAEASQEVLVNLTAENLEAFLNAGWSIETQLESGATALHYFARDGAVKILEKLVEHQADVEARMPLTGFFDISFNERRRHTLGVELPDIISDDAWLDQFKEDRFSAFDIAVAAGRPQAARFLLDAGCPCGAPTGLAQVVALQGFTNLEVRRNMPPHFAEVLPLLITDCGADSATQHPDSGDTLLHLAIWGVKLGGPSDQREREGSKIVRMLVSLGTDVLQVNEHGDLPAEVAPDGFSRELLSATTSQVLANREDNHDQYPGRDDGSFITHSTADSSFITHSSGERSHYEVAMDGDLLPVLEKNRLAQFLPQITEMGATHLEDARFLTDAELRDIGMAPVEVRRFRYAVAVATPDSDADEGGDSS